MCDFSQITPSFVVAAAGVIAAIVSLVIAIALNNGFFSAPGSPVAMLVAGISCIAAVAALSFASNQISLYYECVGSPVACAGALFNVMNALNALRVVLGIQATACFVAAGIAWIPWVGAVPMYIILASLITQMALIPSLYIFIGDLVSCVQNEEAKASVSVIVLLTVAVWVLGIGLTAYVRRDMVATTTKRNRKRED